MRARVASQVAKVMHAWTLYVSYWRQVTAAMKGVVRRKVRSTLSHGLSCWLQNTLMMGQLELMGADGLPDQGCPGMRLRSFQNVLFGT